MEEFDIDSNLEEIVEDIDSFLTEFCVKYKMSPLMVSSVLLARLSQLNKMSDTLDEFGKLLNDIDVKIRNKELSKSNILH